MTGKVESNGLAKLRAMSGQEPPEPVPADDSWESPSGDGRNSLHGTLSCQLIKGKRIIGAIIYGAVQWYEGDFNGTAFKVQFFRGEALVEVVIEGTVAGLQPIIDRITAGKRESCRVNDSTITDIRIREVPPPPNP